MNFPDILYILFIWPVRFVIEFLFVLFNRTFYDAGFAIVVLSFVVNAILLPVYTVADRWQDEEREKQKRMKNKLRDIRAVFKGDERQMIINTYYRQQGYSPVSALKSSVGLLLQVPFFLAAYWFLAHTPSIIGESFLFLRNLDKPDGLLNIGGISINIMPILMTAINLASAFVYAKGLGIRDKVQLFGMAGLFLVLLYHSPSGLVLYWTCNNIFSLGKNIACAKLKRPVLVLRILSSVAGAGLLIGALGGAFDVDRYVFLFVGIGIAFITIPFVWSALVRFIKTRLLHPKDTSFQDAAFLYFSSAILLAILVGLLIPSQVIGESTSDFEKPLSFLLRTFFQSISFFLLVPALVWAFASTAVRALFSALSAMTAFCALICLFALSASYGVMTNSFKIEDTSLIVNAFPKWVSLAAVFAAFVVPCAFLFFKQQKILSSVYNAVALALLVMCIINISGMIREAQKLAAKMEAETAKADETETSFTPVFCFTKTGTNTFVMFLDRAIGAAMFTALVEMPELKTQFDGFTFYPNTVSFGNCTVVGLPPMIGGYDYTPERINARGNILLKDKINESLTLLPKIFGESGVRVTITDPAMTNLQLVPDLSVFKGMQNVTAQNLDNRYNKRFLEEFAQKSAESNPLEGFDFDILFRYGIFRIAPPILRYGLHYKGTWWRDGASNAYGHALTEFSTLWYLGAICSADNGADTFSIFMNETTHEPGAYTKDLFPTPGVIRYSDEEIAKFGSEDNCSYLYTFMAALRAVTQWLDSLKTLGVYDNTRIVIVSDHGSGFKNSLFDKKIERMVDFNPLFMVKERNSRGELVVSNEFMTNADTVSFVTADLDNPQNPFLNIPLSNADKDGILSVVNAVSSQPRRHGPYLLNFSRVRKLIGKNIFKSESWQE
ncbi:MAG: YidC/Oxa1 family membrane protein insertase [Treponema sp.]|jgi:YidC/Oxa1 family membrane protein insertase|nr:YidC/Oxa1 family membrane protein insertase [Treponema sp.]